MRHTKRVVAALLAALLVFSILPLNLVFAEETPDNQPNNGEAAEAPEIITVTGIVADEDGIAVSAAQIFFYEDSPAQPIETTTDEEGRFSVELTPNMEYSVRIEAGEDFASYITEFQSGFDYDFGQIQVNYINYDITVKLIMATASYETSKPVKETATGDGLLLTVRQGTDLMLVFTANEGCELDEYFAIDDATRAMPEDGALVLEDVREEHAITVRAHDVLPPVIESISISDEHDWAQSKVLTVNVQDNISPAEDLSVYLCAAPCESYLEAARNGTRIEDGSCVLTENGEYVIWAMDKAGNKTSQFLTVEKIDSIAPVIEAVPVDHPQWAREVTFAFTATDNGEMESVVWTDANGISESLSLQEDGQYSVTIRENGELLITATDKAGNVSEYSSEIDNIDRIAPSFGQILVQETWDQEKNVVTIPVTDNNAVASLIVTNAQGYETDILVSGDNGVYSFTADENGEYTVTAADEAGNVAKEVFSVNRIDTEVPAITQLLREPDAEWTPSAVDIVVMAGDSQSGVSAVYWTDDVSEFTESWATAEDLGDGSYKVHVDNAEDLYKTYRFIAVDGTGRRSEEVETTIGIDVTAPETFTMTYDRTTEGGFFEEVMHFVSFGLLFKDFLVIHLNASDKSSGIAYYEYQLVEQDAELSEEAWERVETEERVCDITIEHEDFCGFIYARVYDRTGNGTEIITDMQDGASILAVLENTPEEEGRAEAPEITATHSNGSDYDGSWTKDTITLTATCEGPISGVKRYEYQILPYGQEAIDEDGWLIVEDFDVETNLATVDIDEDTNADVLFRAVSYAENPTKESRFHVKVQKTVPENAALNVAGTEGKNEWYVSEMPTITLTNPMPAESAAPIKTYYTFSSSGTDLETATCELSTNGQPVISRDGVYDLTVWTVDAANNHSAETLHLTIKVDTTAPTGISITTGSASLLAEDASAVVFKHIYKDAIEIRTAANTDVSGTASVSFQKIEKVEAFNADGWQPMPEDGIIRMEPNERGVIFVRYEDMAGNVTVAHTDGIIMDDVAPTGIDAPEITLKVIGANENGYFAGDAAVTIQTMDPLVNNAASGIRSITYSVVTDGATTECETLTPYGAGTYLTRTGIEVDKDEHVSSWNGKLTVSAELNNSDNIAVSVTVVDNAGNARTTQIPVGAIKIDTTAPVATISYDNNTADTSFETGPYFDRSRTATITVRERNFDNSLAILTITRNGTEYPVDLVWTKHEGSATNRDDNYYTAQILFTQDGDYTVAFGCRDLAGNAGSFSFTEETLAGDRFVVDQTAPVITVTYDNNAVFNGTFFDAQRTATIAIEEVNFEETRFEYEVTASLNERAMAAPQITTWVHNGSMHTARIRYAADGDYTFDVHYTDMAGNKADAATYPGASAPTSFTVDTTPVDVIVDGVSNNTPYAGDMSFSVTYADINLSEYSLTLLRTSMEIVDEDVTDVYVDGAQTGKYMVAFPMKALPEDGIYTLKYRFTDKAGHVTEDTIRFTVNRFGSVFEYSEDLLALIGGYKQDVKGDFRITAYNPSPVTEDMLTITRDGEPLANGDWQKNILSADGEHWFSYEYVISEQNFLKDGMYRVILTTKDEAENAAENTNLGKPDIIFWVDATAPEITNVIGMENAIVNAPKQEVRVSVYDTIGLSSVKVYIDGELAKEFTEFADESHATVTFDISEGLRHKVRILVTDKAGNELDTDSEQFAPAFQFSKEITVSENFFVRWFANPWVFFGSIFGIAAAGVGTAAGVVAAKRKKL